MPDNSLTLEQFRAIARKQSDAAPAQPRAGARTQKYGAKPTGGYASRKECRRAAQLRQMQAAGLISDLREQVPFLLLPPQYGPDGHLLERQCRYIADFVYLDNASGQTVVEDTKGVRTKEYVIKRKMMLFFHNVTITEI